MDDIAIGDLCLITGFGPATVGIYMGAFPSPYPSFVDQTWYIDGKPFRILYASSRCWPFDDRIRIISRLNDAVG